MKYAKYTGQLKSNYYLPFGREDSPNCLLDKYDPIASCPEMYRWITNVDGSHVTATNLDPQFRKTVYSCRPVPPIQRQRPASDLR
ncbi:hypothetical protein QW180_16285 [Vibrio sinaloensis]|nr:hypothetical protein [Vibrio sinaloensis]